MKSLYFCLLSIFFLVSTNLSQAQRILNRTCATHDVISQYLLDNYTPEQLRNASPVIARRAESDTAYTVPIVNSDTVYTIQVVVHIVYLEDNKYENISDELVQSQIDALNRDFNLENDLSNIRPEFQKFIGNARIRFELAKVDPKGNPTTGITRKKSKPILLPDWNPVFDNIKNTAAGGVNPWAPNKYLNIWVCDLNISRREKGTVDVKKGEGILGGIANPPQGLPNWQIDIEGIQMDGAQAPPIKQGVVIDFRFFGQHNEFNKDYLNSSLHYGLGRTTVHEVGHYLGLRHQWGDYGPILELPCEQFDDGITDTPNEYGPFSNAVDVEKGDICNQVINSCNVPYPGDGIDYPDMSENYMDYSTDLCYGMFTKEQVNMMRYALTKKRTNIITERKLKDTVVPTGIKQLTKLEAVIYPNPVENQINIRLNQILTQDANLSVVNLLGEIVYQQKIEKHTKNIQISVDKLASGTYILHLENKNAAFTQKISKL
ncbi:MAG: zinc-dependent metalloprotease [Chitinophagales bacterium]|nr:zinc-dependent metalloprotease [Chitinophagales bacterium]